MATEMDRSMSTFCHGADWNMKIGASQRANSQRMDVRLTVGIGTNFMYGMLAVAVAASGPGSDWGSAGAMVHKGEQLGRFWTANVPVCQVYASRPAPASSSSNHHSAGEPSSFERSYCTCSAAPRRPVTGSTDRTWMAPRSPKLEGAAPNTPILKRSCSCLVAGGSFPDAT